VAVVAHRIQHPRPCWCVSIRAVAVAVVVAVVVAVWDLSVLLRRPHQASHPRPFHHRPHRHLHPFLRRQRRPVSYPTPRHASPRRSPYLEPLERVDPTRYLTWSSFNPRTPRTFWLRSHPVYASRSPPPISRCRATQARPNWGAWGVANADPLSPPVDLQLHAKDIVTNADVPLPDGALAQSYLVSLPVLAEPADPDQTFTWLVAVQEDGQFLGYMRYPSTFDPQTNSLSFELTGQGVQTISALPVILSPSKVQTFLSDVHTWSSPFKDGVDFGVLGPVWNSYAVLAPQVGGRIGILSPDGSGMIWIDASGVGPAGNATADNPPVVQPPVGASTPATDLAVVEPDATAAP
jgi:hypothetical protein